jgi:DNA-binding beta-propeller fold protein YncE
MLAGILPRARSWLLALLAVAAAGCGSETDVGRFPRAAEPAQAQPLARTPAGRTLRIGRAPEGVVVDPASGIVAVAVRDPDAVALVDGRAGKLLRTVGVPAAARHLALAGPGGPVLVPAERSDRLVRVTLPRGRVSSVRVGAFPHDAAQSGGRVFVGDERGDTLSIVEGDRVVRRLKVARQPGGVTVLGGGSLVAVVSVRERVLEVYDARTLERVGRAPAGVGPTHVVSDEHGLLYVVDTAGDALLVFRVKPQLQLTRRVRLPGAPYGVAYDPVRLRLWVTASRDNTLTELRARGRPAVRRTFPSVRQPDTVAVDPVTGRVFVTGRADGVLQVLDPGYGPLRRSR